jgi:hypothetical protein
MSVENQINEIETARSKILLPEDREIFDIEFMSIAGAALLGQIYAAVKDGTIVIDDDHISENLEVYAQFMYLRDAEGKYSDDLDDHLLV